MDKILCVIERRADVTVKKALARQPAVALIGPRQVGKTTLARNLAEWNAALYLDLEDSSDRIKLADPARFFDLYEDRLVVLDEIHRVPELFATLRGVIDRGRRRGHKTSRFLILGSASMDLLKQSSESLAGRIAYVEMGPLEILEIGREAAETTALWVRGGFPESYLAASDSDSFEWRRDFIRNYLERDVPQFGPRIPAETLERLWTMLAHEQGTQLNASRIATSLMTSAQTVTRYVDLLVDLLLARRLQPFHSNVGKRLVKSPRVFVRDSGLVHALLGIADHNALTGHPVAGASWEGFVIENLIAAAPVLTVPGFYRTVAGAEIDLVLEIPGHGLWALEIRRSPSSQASKGFYSGCEDLKADHRFVVNAGSGRWPMGNGVIAIGFVEMAEMLVAL